LWSGLASRRFRVHEDGEFEFWYDDGDLFWGHVILVDGNIQTGLSQASIAG